MTQKTALVLFSGGQDSTVCLASALERFDRVETVGFAYGQRHEIELVQRQRVLSEIRRLFPRWAARIGDDYVIEMAELGALSETALTRDVAIEMNETGLPSTFVPGRNLLFFTYAQSGFARPISAMRRTASCSAKTASTLISRPILRITSTNTSAASTA